MCIEVVISNQAIERVFWSFEDLAIVIPPNLPLTAALGPIRAILNDLSAPMDGPLTCYCGERITIPLTLLLEAHSGTPNHEQPTPDPQPGLRLP